MTIVRQTPNLNCGRESVKVPRVKLPQHVLEVIYYTVLAYSVGLLVCAVRLYANYHVAFISVPERCVIINDV